MIVCAWLNQSPDPHYGGHRAANRSELVVLDTIDGQPATVLTDCLPAGVEGSIEFVRVAPLGGNPYFDRWHHLHGWLKDQTGFVWAVDANDVRLLNDPYPDWLREDVLYVGSEPTTGIDARSVGFWWVRQLHGDHADWIDANADLPLLNAGLVGANTSVLAEFVADLLEAFNGCPTDITEMAVINKVLYERWSGRFVTGSPVHTPMWSHLTADPEAVWAHK